MLGRFLFLMLAMLMLVSCGCQQDKGMTAAKISYDADGMIRVDGERVFLLGSYFRGQSAQSYQELAEAGFNLVRCEADTEQLNKAAVAGLHTWVTVGSIDATATEASRNKILTNVNAVKYHPSLLFWETADKPAWTWNKAEWAVPPEIIIANYQAIKAADPEHLLYLNQAPANLVSTLKKYNAGTDITGCSIFPVIKSDAAPMYGLFPDGEHGDLLNTSISQVGQYVRKMRRVIGPNQPLIMVLQDFCWESVPGKNQNTDLCRFPSRHETRFMAYQAIARGANGLNWGQRQAPISQTSEFFLDLKSVVSELASIQDILAAPAEPKMRLVKNYYEMGHSIDMGVQVYVKPARGTYFLIAVNQDKNPVKVGITGFGRENAAAVLFENRSIDIKNRELIDTFEPFEVHVYQLKND